ncbi:MAG: hypothetical protein AAF615_04010, partial [Pseudomonadota bacterium]
TGEPFEPGQSYYAALVEETTEPEAADTKSPVAPKLGFARIDISSQAWDEGYRPPRLFLRRSARSFSSWGTPST